jgi:ABC-type antimicrobial peptide transport system permease subunit
MLFSYAWKELTRRKTRSALSVLGIFFSIGLLVAVLAISDFFRDAMSLPFRAAGADMVVETFVEPGPWKNVRLARHCGPIPESMVEEFRRLPGVREASGFLHFWSWEEPRMINVAGVDPSSLRVSPVSPEVSMREAGGAAVVIKGRSLTPEDAHAAVLDRRYAEQFELDVGSVVRLAGEDYHVVGVADMQGLVRVGQAEVFIPLKDAQRLVAASHGWLADMGPIVNMLLVKTEVGVRAETYAPYLKKLVASATKLKPEQVKVFTSRTILPDTTGVSALTERMVQVISLLMLIGVALLVVKTSLLAVSERTSEIGIMKAVGWRDGAVARLITLETALQGLIGGVLGCMVGYGVAYAYALTARFNLPYGVVPYSCLPAAAPPQSIAAAMSVSWPLVGGALAIAVGIGVMAGYVASRRAATLVPAQALRRI